MTKTQSHASVISLYCPSLDFICRTQRVGVKDFRCRIQKKRKAVLPPWSLIIANIVICALAYLLLFVSQDLAELCSVSRADFKIKEHTNSASALKFFTSTVHAVCPKRVKNSHFHCVSRNRSAFQSTPIVSHSPTFPMISYFHKVARLGYCNNLPAKASLRLRIKQLIVRDRDEN